MPDSRNKNKNLLTPEKAAWFIPFFISSCISIFLISLFVIPKYLKSNEVNSQLNELIKKKNELNLLKTQYELINQKFEKLSKEKTKIIELITGTSKLDTLLAKLGELGERNNIEFISIVPKQLIYSNGNNDMKNTKNTKKTKKKKQNKNRNNITSPDDPLFVEGTKKYLIDVKFRTDFINLLAFLRDIEFQDNVILINDINLKLINKINIEKNIENTAEMLEANLLMTFYGKS